MEPPSFDFFDSYMIDHSFILFLTQLLSNDALVLDSWAAAIRSDSRLAHIDNWVDTGRVPVTLGDIGHLCERQVSNNIQRIEATHTQLFGFAEFRRFALVTCRYVRTLILANRYAFRPGSAFLGCADLPDLVTLISESLPSLLDLTLSLSTGWSDVENMSKSYLDPTIGHGTVYHLVLFGPDCGSRHFNLIRYLARICSSDAILEIGHGTLIQGARQGITWGTKFLSYLHRQPQIRQQHLATLDFASVDVTHLKEVHELQFDDNGQPIPRGQSKAQLWIQRNSGIGALSNKLQQDMVGDIESFGTALSEFQAVTGTGHRDSVLAAAETLNKSLEDLRSTQRSLAQLVDGGMDEELANLIETLKVLPNE